MMGASENQFRREVLTHLESLLTDRRFASAERNAKFLRYVVGRALEGRTDEIKETVIATEVYGRAAGYDPKTDSIVRVEATRLRQKLRAYYEDEGRDTPIRIHLPSGSYVPRFETPPLKPVELPQPVPHGPARYRQARVVWLGIAVLLVALIVLSVVRKSQAAIPPAREALAAWQEGVALLAQDPHTGQTEKGAPLTLTRAMEKLELAVSRDPNFAPAWATLAEAYDYAFAYVGRDPEEDARRAEAAARRAIELDGKLAAGHHMLGLVQRMMRWDSVSAERSYRRALELDPRNVYAIVELADILRENGRFQEAADLVRQSRALLPALPQLATKEAEIHLDLGRPQAAIAAANAALQLRRDFLRAYIALGMADESLGNAKSALARYEYVLTVDQYDRRALPAYGYLLARTGQHGRAKEIAERLEWITTNVRNCAFQVAVVYAGLGEHDRALDWLERAWRTRQMHFPFAAVEPRFRDLRENPRFRELLARAGLKPV